MLHTLEVDTKPRELAISLVKAKAKPILSLASRLLPIMTDQNPLLVVHVEASIWTYFRVAPIKLHSKILPSDLLKMRCAVGNVMVNILAKVKGIMLATTNKLESRKTQIRLCHLVASQTVVEAVSQQVKVRAERVPFVVGPCSLRKRFLKWILAPPYTHSLQCSRMVLR